MKEGRGKGINIERRVCFICLRSVPAANVAAAGAIVLTTHTSYYRPTRACPGPPCSPQRYCDPRLNYAQSLEMSFRMAQFLQDEKGGNGGEGGVGGTGEDEGENGAKRRKTAE